MRPRRDGLIPLLIDRIKSVLVEPTSEEAEVAPVRRRGDPPPPSKDTDKAG